MDCSEIFETLYIKISDKDPACKRLVPGLNRIKQGVDVTQLDFLPLDLHGSHGYKQPIIDFTCNQGRKWDLDGVGN